jgi:hypothetical protein
MNQDLQHLKLLSIFHYIVGGMSAMCACFPIIYFVFGLVMILAPASMAAEGESAPPAIIGWFVVFFASCAMLMGWALAVCILLAGRFLSQRRHYMYCLVMAGIMCALLMPYGTVLGVFTIIVLLRPSVKSLFESPVRVETQPQS